MGTTLHRGARAPHYRGLSCCGAQAPDAQAQQLWLTGLVAPRHVGSSQTRARTRVPRTGRQALNHCATREALSLLLNNLIMIWCLVWFSSRFLCLWHIGLLGSPFIKSAKIFTIISLNIFSVPFSLFLLDFQLHTYWLLEAALLIFLKLFIPMYILFWIVSIFMSSNSLMFSSAILNCH